MPKKLEWSITLWGPVLVARADFVVESQDSLELRDLYQNHSYRQTVASKS